MSVPNDDPAASSAARNRTAERPAVASSAGSNPGPSPSSSVPPGSAEESGRARRGLDRLSGDLRELGFEVLSRRQRHERDKSNSSNKSSANTTATHNALNAGGPKSPDLHKTSPPYSRTNTAEGNPRSPDLANVPQPPLSATTSSLSPATPSDPTPPSGASGISRRPAQRASGGSSSQTPMKKPTFVLVTQDHEQLSRVDLNGLPSSAAIRERLYTKAHIPDDDFSHCTVHLSSLEQTDPGTPLDDSELWQICQGVLSGEITPPPLFYVQLSVAGSSSELPYSQPGPPDYPSLPYDPVPPGSAHSDGHPERFGSRPDSHVETSSNSSVSRPRTTQQQQSRRSPHDPKPPSPMRREAQDVQFVSDTSRKKSQERRPSYHSPPLDQQSPYPPFFDAGRRSSAGSVNVPVDQRDQQYLFDRRSSAGESDRSHQPEFMERPANLRRADRQARSEAQAVHVSDDWQNGGPSQPSYASMGRGHSHQGSGYTQTMGMGPDGPLYRPVNQASRSRSNSASAQDMLQSGRPGPAKNTAPMGFGPSGPLHFPQPIHHGQYPQQSARRPPPTIVEHPQPFQSGSHPNGRGLNIAKSMDNLRAPHSDQSSYHRQELRTHNNGALTPIPQRSGGQEAHSRLYEDPRQPGNSGSYRGQDMRSGFANSGRPVSAQAMHPPVSTSSSSNPRSPDTQAYLRSPPTHSGSRIPSYPPYSQQPSASHNQGNPPRLPPRQNMPMPQYTHAPQYAHAQQGGHQRPLQPHHAYTQPGIAQRRPSSDLLQRAGPTALQVIPGPGRLPLQPGETLQDALHQKMDAPPPQRPARTSPQASMAANPRVQVDSGHDYRYPQPQKQTRSASWEERPQSYFEASEAGLRSGHSYSQDQRFAEDAPFTSSPPAQYTEQQPNLYIQDTSSRKIKANNASPPLHSQSSPVFGHRDTQHSSSNRSSSSSVEPQRSPASSRPSTSSGGPFADSSVSTANRPASHSSVSTNEVPTPVSDSGQKQKALADAKSPKSAREAHPPSLRPQMLDQDQVYEGVEMLREQIDAVTEDAHGSRPNTASAPAHYVDNADEQSETMKARQWADAFVDTTRIRSGDDGDDTLGKHNKRKSGASEGESSTMGKSKPQTTVESDKSTKPTIAAPPPVFSYNPDEDDDDEAMTWAVQMQPTKSTAESPRPTSSASAKAPGGPDTPVEVASLTTRKDPPKHIALPPANVEVGSPVPSPRSEKPLLRVKTDVSAQAARLAAEGKAPLSGVSPSRSESKRSASPRSAHRRPRQNSKDGNSAVDDSIRRTTGPVRSGPSKDSSSLSMARRASFNDNAWAYRPSVEQVYDNLEEFFPGHDLDKPIVDAGMSGPNSGLSSPALDSALASPGLTKTAEITATAATKEPETPARASRHHDHLDRESSRRFNHNRKSIRMVAQDRKSRLKKEEVAAKALSSIGTKEDNKEKLARRKSTKVWGRKIEEVTSAEADLLYSARDPASADKDRGELAPVKWLKGELIGKGTYGHVYIGFNVTNGEMFAVKQVELPRTASDKDDNRQTSVVDALRSEMDLLKDLEHEKIVSYLGFEETPQHMSIFLEYVDGGSVGRCLRKHGKFEEQVIQFFTVQILEGLEYLHSRGILHRDLKADNILVRMDGTVKISDFGISKKSNDIYNNNSNMSMQGSIFWMAPEVVHNQKKGYSAKIDIWSLGCVVLEMFAGRRPWDSEEAIQAMFKLGAERLAPPVPQDVVLSNQSSHFLKECFHADPDKRPQASRLLCHKFLTLDKSWDFHMSALYRAMSS